MVTSQENNQRLFEFHNYQVNQKRESLSICESIALWLSPPPEDVKEKKKKNANKVEYNQYGV
jgi:hypothetical protein